MPENERTMQAVTLNYERGMYLLKNYRSFRRKLENRLLQPGDSLTVLKILAYSMSEHDAFTQRDQEVLQECGSLLVGGIDRIMNRMKEMPEESARASYCVLFEKYIRLDMAPPSEHELLIRLLNDGFSMTRAEMIRFEMMGVSMFSSMAFQSLEQSAWLCSEKILKDISL